MERDIVNQINERLDMIEFRQELLFKNTGTDRLFFQYNITRDQYNNIMDLMDSYREKVSKNDDVNHSSFENDIYKIVPFLNENYSFCEGIAQAFAEEKRWEDVFDKLYGSVDRYKFVRD